MRLGLRLGTSQGAVVQKRLSAAQPSIDSAFPCRRDTRINEANAVRARTGQQRLPQSLHRVPNIYLVPLSNKRQPFPSPRQTVVDGKLCTLTKRIGR